ncbi:integrase [Pseudomonas sp. SDI]|uniref:DNA-binding protein n=1 Tax=Pseudomonas sp. SDI TaxID=2170734 RepID=UPI000DE706CF|nr:DNA-binding protein [Pseudomonas sp. SDI]PWB35051.1 integrase [Pseudomonas sp. SDI]
MARGGINKAVVQKARQALLARGEHPSIDAVRIEMGNTGSKTTIHRYLKELESLQPTATLSVPALSESLSQLVAQLAERLQEEGAEQIETARVQFEQARETLQAQLQISQQALAALQQQQQIQAAALASESEALATCRSALQTEQSRNASLNQSVGELNLRLADRDEQIRSLEDKHQHARDALEHYRAASREQREQDQRRHEAQVQQVQMEVRQLQQTLIVKQDELTRLNRDNERLLVEARQAQRERQGLQDVREQQALEVRTLSANLAQSLGAREELLRQNQGLAEHVAGVTLVLEETQQALRLALAQLQEQAEPVQPSLSPIDFSEPPDL